MPMFMFMTMSLHMQMHMYMYMYMYMYMSMYMYMCMYMYMIQYIDIVGLHIIYFRLFGKNRGFQIGLQADFDWVITR